MAYYPIDSVKYTHRSSEVPFDIQLYSMMLENELREILGMPLLEEKVDEVVEEGPVLEFDEWVEQTNEDAEESQLTLKGYLDTWVRLVYTGTGSEFWEICVRGDIDFYYRPSLRHAQADVYEKLGYKVYV